MKIGIVTYHRSHNYGAYLQSYALSNYLKQNLNIDAEIIDFDTKVSRKVYMIKTLSKSIAETFVNLKRYRMFGRALKSLTLSENTLISDDIEAFVSFVKDKYDIIITGSDEVWRFGSRGFPNAYWLPGNLGCKKIAYAVSSRSDFSKLSESEKKQVAELLSGFEYIGVRDNETYRNVKDYLQDPSRLCKNCDPVFLYDFKQSKQNGRKILKERFSIDTSKPTIAIAIADRELSKKMVADLNIYYGDKLNYIALYTNYTDIPFCPDLTPFEWIDVIAASDFLLTSLFHGMCFAIKYDTPFLTIECRKGEKTIGKNYDILSEEGLLERLTYIDDPNLFDKVKERLDTDIGREVSFEEVCKNQRKKAKSFDNALEELILQGEDDEEK